MNAVPFPAGEEKIGDKILAFRRKRRVKCIGAAAADHILHPGDGVVKFERAALHSKCIKQAGAQFLRHVKIVIIDKGGIGRLLLQKGGYRLRQRKRRGHRLPVKGFHGQAGTLAAVQIKACHPIKLHTVFPQGVLGIELRRHRAAAGQWNRPRIQAGERVLLRRSESIAPQGSVIHILCGGKLLRPGCEIIGEIQNASVSAHIANRDLHFTRAVLREQTGKVQRGKTALCIPQLRIGLIRQKAPAVPVIHAAGETAQIQIRHLRAAHLKDSLPGKIRLQLGKLRLVTAAVIADGVHGTAGKIARRVLQCHAPFLHLRRAFIVLRRHCEKQAADHQRKQQGREKGARRKPFCLSRIVLPTGMAALAGKQRLCSPEKEKQSHGPQIRRDGEEKRRKHEREREEKAEHETAAAHGRPGKGAGHRHHANAHKEGGAARGLLLPRRLRDKGGKGVGGIRGEGCHHTVCRDEEALHDLLLKAPEEHTQPGSQNE